VGALPTTPDGQQSREPLFCATLSASLELPLRLRERYMLASYLSRQTTLLFRTL
jgi:hypothetical protein